MQQLEIICPCCKQVLNLFISPGGAITTGVFDISQTEIVQKAHEQNYEFGTFDRKEDE